MSPSLRGKQMTDADLLSHLLTGAYEIDEQLLDTLLSEGVPMGVAVRRAVGGRWRAGITLLLGGALALGSVQGTAHAVAASVSTTIQSQASGALSTLAAKVVGVGAERATVRASIANELIADGTVLIIPTLTIDAQQGTAPTTYQVQPGDTLWGIAQRFYGNGANWDTIYNANRAKITNPHWIYPGQSLSIPPALVANVNPQNVPAPGTSVSQYTVKPGDSLWSIAQQVYGNPARWGDIYNANAGIIGANPSLIFSGTVLKIPS